MIIKYDLSSFKAHFNGNELKLLHNLQSLSMFLLSQKSFLKLFYSMVIFLFFKSTPYCYLKEVSQLNQSSKLFYCYYLLQWFLLSNLGLIKMYLGITYNTLRTQDYWILVSGIENSWSFMRSFSWTALRKVDHC